MASTHARQAVQAAILAARAGQTAQVFTAPEALNNLNYKLNSPDPRDPQSLAPVADRSPAKPVNLNNLKAAPTEKRGGVPRLTLYTDETLKKALGWGVQEWLVQVSIRDYGLYTVKSVINRLYQLPDGYFKPQYGPIAAQRGRLFNKEMQKLKLSKHG